MEEEDQKVQESRMLLRLVQNNPRPKITKLPLKPNTLIAFDNGVSIFVNDEGEMTIKGQKSLNFEAENINFVSKTLNIDAQEGYNLNVNGTAYIGASEHIIQQAPRIDFNPYVEEQTNESFSGYFSNKENPILKKFKRLKRHERKI